MTTVGRVSREMVKVVVYCQVCERFWECCWARLAFIPLTVECPFCKREVGVRWTGIKEGC